MIPADFQTSLGKDVVYFPSNGKPSVEGVLNLYPGYTDIFVIQNKENRKTLCTFLASDIKTMFFPQIENHRLQIVPVPSKVFLNLNE